jgi:peptidoglycan glycosyltransferase
VNRPIRRVGYAVTVLILLLVGQLTYLQVVDANNLANDPKNVRKQLKDFNRARGKILTADGQIVAESRPTTGDFKYQRVYPQVSLFAHVAGYQSFVNLVGSTGVEASYNKVLTGQDTSLQLENLGNALSGKADTNDVVLSLTQSAQQAAVDALGGQRGSVVALDVQTGAVVAMYSNPTFNPNGLSVHNTQVVQDTFNQINSDANGKPALQRAYRDRYSPGSTFKVVTSKSAIEAGLTGPDDRVFDFEDGFQIPGTSTILRNFGGPGSPCGGTLRESLIGSCNATFARLGYELGDRFPPAMQECGIESAPPIDLAPKAEESVGPLVGADQARFALAGIGQGDVFTTPLQMALIAESIANNGVIREPHVVQEIRNSDGQTVRTIEAKDWTTCMQPTTAAALTSMMVDVVNEGTGTEASLADDGIQVAGKTGTAQTGIEGESPHAWFIAFAPANAPRYAIAVIVEHGGDFGSEATGGEVAAPIAKRVLQNLLATNS